MKDAKEGGRTARGYARAIVALRPLIVVAWIAVAVAAWFLLPPLGGSTTAPLDDIVPAKAKAFDAQERALERFGSTLGSDTVVVQRNPKGLSQEEIKATAAGAAVINSDRKPEGLSGVKGALPLVNVDLPGVKWGEQGTTALTYLFLGPELNLVERESVAKAYARGVLKPEEGSRVGVTGAASARLEQFRAIEDVLPIVTLATIGVILLIVAVHFRSIGAPLVTLLTAGVAYVAAIRALAWTGERFGVTVPSEIEPVLVVLLLGLVTDYTIFFMSEARRRIARGDERLPAVRAATTRIAPIVLTAGVLVAGCAVALMAGEMQFFRVFGPGMAVAALVVTFVCVTFVPAILALCGGWLFRRHAGTARPAPVDTLELELEHPDRLGSERGEQFRMRRSGMLGALRASRRQSLKEGGPVITRFGARMLATRPLALLVVLASCAALGVLAYGARNVDLQVSHIPSLPPESDARAAAEDAQRGLAKGVLAPTEVVVEQSGITRRRDGLEKVQAAMTELPGVAAVIGPRQAVDEDIEPAVLSRDGDAARYAVFLSNEATSAQAVDDLGTIRRVMPRLLRDAGIQDARISYGGETALSQETVDGIVDDLGRVAIAASLITLLLLAIFLRALVAPVLLLIGSILAFAASFGITALLLPLVLGGDDVVYYVPLVAAVLLVGLGSDYNVFIAGRIREEAAKRRLREAIAVGAPSASRAITVAGITLASTFALLAIVPLRPFRELALLMTIGVLVDALFVRPVLIPAMIAAAGQWAWWPGRANKPISARVFLDAVARRSGLNHTDARSVTAATFTTLSERIPENESRQIAMQLPSSIAGPLAVPEGNCTPFGADEFVARVVERTALPPEYAQRDVTAVFSALREILPSSEIDYIRAALSEDYRPLLGDTPEQRAAEEAEQAPAAVRA